MGGLRALERQVASGVLQIRGYAGTSAGALIACLAACGVTSTEIIGAGQARTLVDVIRERAGMPQVRRLTDLFGRHGWLPISAVRLVGRTARALPAWTAWTLGIGLVVAAIVLTSGAQRWLGFTWGAVLAILAWTLLAGLVFWIGMGLVRLNTLRIAVSRLLKKQVFGDADAPDEVTFATFNGEPRPGDARAWPLLKIVAASIGRHELVLFSCDGERCDIPVADAVCASVCIPFIFRPWRIEEERFVDGGIVSNFPAWPFDEERALDPEALTIGFQIGERQARKPGQAAVSGKGPVFWPTAVLLTALVGARILSTRAVGRAELITLPASLDPLDFDVTRETAAAEVDDVATFALTRLDDRLLRFPALYRQTCEQVRQQFVATLQQEGAAILSAPSAAGWVRCGVAIPPAGYRRSLATRFTAGYEPFSDGALLWPIATSLAGKAWSEQEPIFELDPIRTGKELTGELDEALRRRMPADLAWSLRVPIFTTNGRFLVVLVDGSQGLLDNERTGAVIEALIDRVTASFGPVVATIERTMGDG